MKKKPLHDVRTRSVQRHDHHQYGKIPRPRDKVLYLEPAELIRDRIAKPLTIDRSAAGSRWFSQLEIQRCGEHF
jgi:hypothetical protein